MPMGEWSMGSVHYLIISSISEYSTCKCMPSDLGVSHLSSYYLHFATKKNCFMKMSDSQSTSPYEPDARRAPFSAVARGELHVWGGRTSNYSSKINDYTSLQVYSQVEEIWRQITCSGDCPIRLFHGASTQNGQDIYTYGGQDESSYFGSLHKLDTLTSQWSKLTGHSLDGPIRKSACGIVSYHNQLILFGGFGALTHPTQTGSVCVYYGKSGNGWTNELHSFDLTKGKEVVLLTVFKPVRLYHFYYIIKPNLANFWLYNFHFVANPNLATFRLFQKFNF